MMNYHRRYNRVVEEFKEGRLTLPAAIKMICDIEEQEYEKDPLAEPDGDITYAAATAADDIKEINESIISRNI